jgi:excisionase family DNA binding protein
MPEIAMEKMFSINEICRELSVARRTVHHWIATGQLKAFHLGGKRLTRVWEKDLSRFIRTPRPKPHKRSETS